MNEEQKTPETASKAGDDINKVTPQGEPLQTVEGFDNDKEAYYTVDSPKKEVLSNIGDGTMSNEGTVGMGDIAEDLSPDAEGEREDH
jgi:hypothetical protein